MFPGHVTALLAPGQGSQAPGMFTPWLELDGTREKLERWSERAGLDLIGLGTEADAETIQDTAITQPLIVALSLLAYEEIQARQGVPQDAPVAGHSVGELAAAAIAGVLSAEDAVTLAAVRGAEMAKACALEPTSMAAVMLGEPEQVVDWLAGHGLTAANRNGAGQIVASGAADAIERIVAEPLEGTKVRQLKVAGAFHTSYMAPAEEALRRHAASITPADPVRPLLSNADGKVVTSGTEYLDRLVAQVTRPVRWDLTMDGLVALGVTTTVELPPAGTLTGLVKRQLKGTVTTTIALKTPAELAAVTKEAE
ncbi:ACP S-malonyltransferase [Amycolatopsis rhizosphaerae]|uniref:[acyl-carrier-protein] S-malonyltransferase n=1 Tax=Amycolatopsis rhizosphaerae TaxID=2053003 RepID=A0A558B0S4_9PSEU|nr:ACP S-malonyltransferase [Amycolatopsis rhizosphaerae]TVT30084.1 ACP S-malonyltransferase [Amycolatopsis rhizosphaerae]